MKINNKYFVFRIIFDTYGIIMRNKNHIYCVFRIILDTYGIIMRNIYHILSFSDYFIHLCKYNENKNNIYCVFCIILDTYGIIMRNKYHYILCFSDNFSNLWNYNAK